MTETNKETLQQKHHKQKRLKRWFMGFCMYCFAWIFVSMSIAENFTPINLNIFIFFLSLSVFSQLLFLFLFVSNKNLKFSDPNLSTIQMIAALFWITLAMVVLPQLKSILAFFSLACLMYSIFHTEKSFVFWVPFISIVSLAAANLSFYLKFPEQYNLQYSTFEFFVFTGLVVWIGMISRYSFSIRQRLHTQKLELQRVNELLKYKSQEDPLTQLKNRRYFDEKFNDEWKRTTRTNDPLSFIMMDIDFFKRVNDTYGHNIGDECLIFVANVLRKELPRSGDIYARYGGEEFAILLPNTTGEQAIEIANKIRLSLHANPFNSDTITLSITASFGVCSVEPTHVITQSDLALLADKALYHAKQSGRNCVKYVDYNNFQSTNIN